MVRSILLLVLASSGLALRRMREDAATDANPIRKVVTMLQAMQKKIQEEGVVEKDLYGKFQCYCKTGAGDLQATISAAEAKGPQLTSNIEEAESKKSQYEQDLKQHQTDRADAKTNMASATALREKEFAAYAKYKSEADADISAVKKAVTALEKGMAGAFLQTAGAQILRKLTASRDMAEGDRQELLAFFSSANDASYVPQSGEVTGILKTMGDDMSKSLADATTAENEAIANYNGLMAAKKKEVESLTASIETKTQRVGELGVEIVQMKNDLDETTAGLLEDKKFLGNLDTNCAQKAKDFDERTKTRAEELVALAETIKVLNDDDALELFKKTLPSASSSFVQIARHSAAHALASIDALRKNAKNNPQLDFIALALRGKKIGFDKVIKMVDDMVATLKQEQHDDDNKKEYCGIQMDSMDDKKKQLERKVSDEESAIANAEEGIATAAEEINTLQASIKSLDKSVAEATEQRQKEHAEYTNLMASDSAARQLLQYAKNRLNKFYNKALYKPPPKRELSEEDRIAVNMGGTAPPTAAPGGIAGTGITVLSQGKADPGPAPETFSGPYKKSEESTGVIAMIDLLVKDLDKEMTEAETEEKNSQADYEQTMQDAAEKRAQDTKTLTEKTAAKASNEEDLQSHTDSKTGSEKELMAVHEVISSLHSECDWLLQYFDTRKEARAGEVSSLLNAKSILAGADFS